MKKLFLFFLTIMMVSSCEDSIEITTTTSINESLDVSIPQTNGSAVAFDETITQDLSQVVLNFNSINDISIDNLSYKFINLTGNTNALLTSATIEINQNIIANISNVDISQEVTNASVFYITDTEVLDQLETMFLNNSFVTIRLYGMALTDEDDVSFEIEVSTQLTATL